MRYHTGVQAYEGCSEIKGDPIRKKQGSCPLRCPWAARGQRSFYVPTWEFCHANKAAHYFHIWKQWAAQGAAQGAAQ